MPSPPPRRLAELTTADGQPLVGPLVRQAYRWFSEGMQAGLRADAEPLLTMSQVELFTSIDRDGTTIAELARRCDVTRQSAHRLVHDLVSNDLVELVPDPDSARQRLVRPTRSGHRHLLTAQLALVELEERLAAQLGEPALAALRDVLGRDWGDPRPASP